eukprot:jgi/Ulvmu1/1555/UM110_0018.1
MAHLCNLRTKKCAHGSLNPSRRQRSGVVMRAAAAQTMTVSDKMAQLRADGRTAMIPFICAGDPDLETTAEALKALDEAGADIIELGVPYSDPLADGPTIQGAADRALRKGTTLKMVLDMLSSVSADISTPVVLFTYYNPIMARGLDRYCADIRAAGASALVVPDIPLEETAAIRAALNAEGLELVLLTTPTTRKERMERIAAASQGFLYLVSVTGVTGARSEVSVRVQQLLTDIKAKTDLPVCVGFGVSSAQQAQQIKGWGADGVIVGSALVKLLAGAEEPQQGVQDMKELAQKLRTALD